ncbi:MAG: hypothetical protein JXR84_08215 [Anaerolineae bacterium]|nr:hypothetical protein [Anaerolineae bacterium]
MSIDIIGLIVGALVTLVIFSYLLGDNVLYRWMLALLVGSGAGYVMGVVVKVVLLDWFIAAREADTLIIQIYYFVPVFLGILLIFKSFSASKSLRRLSVLGNIPMGYLIGTGAGVAIGGALLGTLFPQIVTTSAAVTLDNLPWGLVRGIVMVGGTIAALLVFSPRPTSKNGETALAISTQLSPLRRVGEFFIIVALAAAFAGAITTGLTLWVERWSAVLRAALSLIGG